MKLVSKDPRFLKLSFYRSQSLTKHFKSDKLVPKLCTKYNCIVHDQCTQLIPTTVVYSLCYEWRCDYI